MIVSRGLSRDEPTAADRHAAAKVDINVGPLTRGGTASSALLRPELPASRLGHESSRDSAVPPASATARPPPLPVQSRGFLQHNPRPPLEDPPCARLEGAIGTTPCLLIGERDRRLYVLGPEKIDYIEAAGNYVKFHVGSIEYIARNSVKRLAVTMAQSGFLRIERSLLVNVRAICYVERAGRGTYSFTLVSGACLHSGAKFRDHILRVLPLAQRP